MSWSWKKRSSSGADSAPAAPAAPAASAPAAEERSPIAADNKVFSSGDDAPTSRWKQGEDRIRELNTRLSTALLDATAKEAAARQHARVAEEAVSGWEKAGAEAEASKRQLDGVLRENAMLQDRLSQLDSALKDCTRQVRLVREEQEHKRQELLQKKNKELDKFRADYEAKLADVGRQLLEAGAENKVMTMSLQEHSRTIGELTDARSRVEAEMKQLQRQVELADKDKMTLKYEVHVLNKEIQIRNEERNYNRREMDASNRQHIEDTKRINKLEAECQKLRILVRRKLPGPNALAQMKMEVESLDSFSLRGSPDLSYKNGNREVELLFERVLSMEEETKMLKEVLAQRNEELNSSRLMCAKAASKLSAMEAYFDSVRQPSKLELGSLVTGSEVNCADAWAMALIAELSQFKKDKLPSNGTDNGFLSPALSIMDDFADMERLAMASDDKSGNETPSSMDNKTPTKEANGFQEQVGTRGLEKQLSRKSLSNELSAAGNEVAVTEQQDVAHRAIILLQNLARLSLSDQAHPAFESGIQALTLLKTGAELNWRQQVIAALLKALNALLPATVEALTVECETQTSEYVPKERLELERVQSEKEALKAEMQVEADKVKDMEKELSSLRAEKADLQAGLDSETRELDEAHKLINDLKARLDGNKEEALVVDEVEAQARSGGTLMQDVVARLERELEEEYKDQEEAAGTSMERSEVLQTEDGGDRRSRQKNQEIVDAEEKLAECQRTILALGIQLKALSGSVAPQAQANSVESSSRLSSGLSLARLHSDGEAEEQITYREKQTFSPARGRMFEELGLSSPLDLSSSTQGSSSPVSSRSRESFAKHKRSSFSRFFVRSTKNSV